MTVWPLSINVMTTPMKHRDIHRALLAHGCRMRQGKGSHEKWLCRCGRHIAIVPNHPQVSPGVVADIIMKLACLPEGWLQ